MNHRLSTALLLARSNDGSPHHSRRGSDVIEEACAESVPRAAAYPVAAPAASLRP